MTNWDTVEAEYEEFLGMAAATVVAYKHGCTCGSAECWIEAIGFGSRRPNAIPVCRPPAQRRLGMRGRRARLWRSGGGDAIALRPSSTAQPVGSSTPRVWKTVEAVARVLTDGAAVEGEEPEEIARLLKAGPVAWSPHLEP